MNSYIIKTNSGRRIIVRANSEEAAKEDFHRAKKITIPWTDKVIEIPGGEPIEKIASLGVLIK
ncbi:MAG: hypothetical protein ACOVQM_10570 [Pirellula sp.]